MAVADCSRKLLLVSFLLISCGPSVATRVTSTEGADSNQNSCTTALRRQDTQNKTLNDYDLTGVNRKFPSLEFHLHNHQQIQLIASQIPNLEPGSNWTIKNSAAKVSPSVLPSFVDNSLLPSFPPVGNQKFNDCTSFSSTYYMMTHNYGLVHGINNKSSSSLIFSPKWTYNFNNSGRDDGASFPNVAGQSEKFGLATLKSYPYSGTFKDWAFNSNLWREAANYRFNSPETIFPITTPDGLHRVKEVLNRGFVVNFGTFINSYQYSVLKVNPSVPSSSANAGQPVVKWQKGMKGGHTMTIVGYDDDVWTDINDNNAVDSGELGAFKIVNQWGANWGHNGFAWIAYDALHVNSKVVGGTLESSGRTPAITSEAVYFQTPRNHYEPKLLAMVEVTATNRASLIMNGGIGEVGSIVPTEALPYNVGYARFLNTTLSGILSFSSGPLAPETVTMYFDLTDLLPSNLDNQTHRYFLRTARFAEAYTINKFEVVDLINGITTQTNVSGVQVAGDLAGAMDPERLYVVSNPEWNDKIYIDYAFPPQDASPVVPSNFSFSTFDGQITLQWSPSARAMNYKLWRAEAGGPFSLIADQISTSYEDKNIRPEATYFYKVQSENNVGASEFSPVLTIKTEKASPATSPCN